MGMVDVLVEALAGDGRRDHGDSRAVWGIREQPCAHDCPAIECLRWAERCSRLVRPWSQITDNGFIDAGLA